MCKQFVRWWNVKYATYKMLFLHECDQSARKGYMVIKDNGLEIDASNPQ